MSAAPVTPIDGKKAASEPKDLRDLYARARADLAGKDAEALLRWIFWHANAVGRLEVARAVLKRFEAQEWEVRARASVYLPGTQQHDLVASQSPKADLERAEALVCDCAAYVQAAASVVETLRGRR